MRFFYNSPKIGQEFIKRLYGQMKVTLFRDGRVNEGRCRPSLRVRRARHSKIGAHPNATKIFVNWLLSREGQLTLQKALGSSQEEAPDSLHIDIPKDEIPVDNRGRDGIEYMDLDREEWMQRDSYVKLVQSTMGKSSKE
jgi:hypothetical protein